MFALYTPGTTMTTMTLKALLCYTNIHFGAWMKCLCVCICVYGCVCVHCDVIVDSKNKNKAEIELYFLWIGFCINA